MKQFTNTRKKRLIGEPWQVIYTDLMTIIMVFFVILWSLNQGKDISISETLGDSTKRMISLPGDVLFSPGKYSMSSEGKDIFNQIFVDDDKPVLRFNQDGLTKRLLIIHGHTDGDGKKDANFRLGFQRALSAYNTIKGINPDVENHAVICSHADNSPKYEVPVFEGNLSDVQRQTLIQSKSKNRRITIEDTVNDRQGRE